MADGRSGKRLGFQYGHDWWRRILNVGSVDEEHVNFNALHCSISGRWRERTLEAVSEYERDALTGQLCIWKRLEDT